MSGTLDPLVPSIAWRYLRGRGSSLLLGTARSALFSILLGVAAMVIAMALMTGYTEDLQRKLIGGGAAIVAYPLGGAEPDTAALESLAALPGVAGVNRVAYAQGSLSVIEQPASFDVTVRGVGRAELERHAGVLAESEEEAPPAILGSELLELLGASVGDRLRLVVVDASSGRFRYLGLRVAGSFETGFSEADRTWLMIDHELLARAGDPPPLLEVSVEDPLATGAVLLRVESLLGDDFLVSDWRDYNRALFTALRLQKIGLFLVLGLIVVVSTFNLASTLVVLTRERRREIGTLAAMGLDPRGIRRVFVLCGLALGAVGAALGVALGWFVSWTVTTFELIRFDPGVAAIYFLSSFPFRVRLVDVAGILGFALVVAFVACWFPARKAAGLSPTEALRSD